MSERIVRADSHTCFGRPRVAGTRVPTWAPVGCFRGGDSLDDVAADYGLTCAEMEECLRFELMTKRQQEKYLAGLDPFKRCPRTEP